MGKTCDLFAPKNKTKQKCEEWFADIDKFSFVSIHTNLPNLT